MISVTRPKIVQCPMIGNPPSVVATSKYASSTSSDSTMKPTITNQCAAPTTPHLSIRVWPAVSTSIVLARATLSAKRSGAGWPSRMTATIFMTARTASHTATAVMAAARTVVTIWTLPIELASPVCCPDDLAPLGHAVQPTRKVTQQ